MFIVEQRGVIKISKRGRILPIPFLDLQSRVLAGGERGLLGLAFHPEHARNRKFYLFFTERASGDLIIAEMHAGARNRDRALPGSFRRLLRVPHRRHANHNGGMLAFGRDGLLYIATGDGGGGGDPDNHAQSRTSRLGKLLRIDVDGRSGGLGYGIPPTNPHATSTTFQREIWSLGLRNPFRFSFDRRTGDLSNGDVGQGHFEEVDRATEASGGGRAVNFGWRLLEGRACFDPQAVATGPANRPRSRSTTTRRAAPSSAVMCTAGRWRSCGAYFFADACSGEIWSVVAEGAARRRKVLMAETDLQSAPSARANPASCS